MSAFVVSDAHLCAIVQAGIDFKAWLQFGTGWGYLTSGQAQHVFEVLKRENVRSVNHRYSETTPAGPDVIGRFRPGRKMSAVETLKAVNCLEYQSNETDEWKTSAARTICQAIKDAAIRELPGYDEAPWNLDGFEAVR